MNPLLTRRQALGALALGAAALSLPRRLRAASAERRLRLAFVGVGGRGRNTVMSMTEHDFVAFADVDDVRAGEVYAAFPSVPRYRDYRAMLDRHHRDIDGVVISTPDHLHYPMAVAAIEAGKHVYLEKPLATTIWECRALAALSRRSKVRTQTGTQGHSFEALRVLREWIDAGAAGRIHTVICWADRLKPHESVWAETEAKGQAVPDSLDWQGWLGPRPDRPYNPQYAPSRWRNWWAFGSGPVADVGVHMFDVLTYALDLEWPDVVEAEVPAISAQTCPPWSKVTWSFPGRGTRPPVTVHWIGGNRDGHLFKPADVPRLTGEIVGRTDNGLAFIGTEATLFIPDMRASVRPRIYPLEREREFLAALPPKRLPRVKGSHYRDWVDAIVEGREAGAPFTYGGDLTSRVLLGTLAQRTGRPVRFSADTMRVTDNAAADAMLRPVVREAWRPIYAQLDSALA